MDVWELIDLLSDKYTLAELAEKFSAHVSVEDFILAFEDTISSQLNEDGALEDEWRDLYGS